MPLAVTPWRRKSRARRISALTQSCAALNNKHFELTQTLDVRAWTLPAEEAQIYRDVSPNSTRAISSLRARW